MAHERIVYVVPGFLSAVALAKAVSRTGRAEFAHNPNGYVGPCLRSACFYEDYERPADAARSGYVQANCAFAANSS